MKRGSAASPYRERREKVAFWRRGEPHSACAPRLEPRDSPVHTHTSLASQGKAKPFQWSHPPTWELWHQPHCSCLPAAISDSYSWRSVKSYSQKPQGRFPLKEPWLSSLSGHQNHLQVLFKRLLAATPEFLTQGAWDETGECAFLTSFQMMLMLRVQGPQFKNHINLLPQTWSHFISKHKAPKSRCAGLSENI